MSDYKLMYKELDKHRIPEVPSFYDNNMNYNIYNCPIIQPPNNYPYEWNAIKYVLKNWNPDNTTIPNNIYNSICIFDYRNKTHHIAIQNYREHEALFIVKYHNDIVKTLYRWIQNNYIKELLSNIS